MDAATHAVSALEAWAATCPEAAPLLQQARALVHRLRMAAVAERAKTEHGVDATAVVWSDARCPLREGGKAAVGEFSMDLTALCKQTAIYFAPKQHLHDLEMAASRPLCDLHMPGGMTLEDFLVDEIQVRTIPRAATMRVQGLVVYDREATIKLRTYRYGPRQTHTFVVMPDGRYGFRSGSGEVGVQGKCIQLQQADPARKDEAEAAPPTLMAVTLWTDQGGTAPLPPMYGSTAVYRGLHAAKLALGDEDVPDGDRSVLQGQDVRAVRVELIACHVAYGSPTDEQVDRMCRHVLEKQRLLGVHGIEAYCHQGHGPWKRGSTCPGCGARVVCGH